jgi:putative exosortase-associated protein (TIGR04073 family)
MIVAAGVLAVIGLGDGTASAGDVVEEPEITYGATVPPAEATACEREGRDPNREPQVEALWKLGRGFHNLIFGLPAELLRNPVIEVLKADTVFGFGAGATEGVLVGVGKGFWRVGAGFLDIVTFPSPIAPWYDCDALPQYPF